jgi:hydrogenase maturation protein HypF
MKSSDALHTAPDLKQQAHLPAKRWIVSGVVQGVGFRPFIFRLASRYGLRGWVKNSAGQVEIVAAGPEQPLQCFEHDFIERAPAIASPRIARVEWLHGLTVDNFRILDSDPGEAGDIHVPVDYFVCADCLGELDNPGDRRYRYPFINCTQCGPRYTLIRALPYDRVHTSMAGFALCAECGKEYRDVHDRRFHAEPVACPACGPQLAFRRQSVEIRDTPRALAACVQALREGCIVAVKGVGGYHLMCDGASDEAIARLRNRKARPDKPLAVMFPDQGALTRVHDAVVLGHDQEALLRGPRRPIVLVERKAGSHIPAAIAPGLNEIGVMLPYSPLHHLLLNDFDGALVATSANIGGEPVLTDNDQVERRLADVADAFLHHDRPIVRPADDPVYRSIHGKPRPIRLGRGDAPLELELPFALPRPVLAVGGHMKNTLCLAWGNRAVLSPHIGDMGTSRSLQVFEQLAADLQNLFGVRAQVLVCDAHPGYVTSRWARKQGLTVFEVQHHAAHASALIGERCGDCRADCLVFTWDGVGWGSDQTLWGGEALYGRPGNWQRVASMRSFGLPGGDKAGREPWRSAVSVAWETGADALAMRVMETLAADRDPVTAYSLLYQAWQKRLNTQQTSAAGRLIDAAAVLTGLCPQASYEGQAPMLLEAAAGGEAAEPLVLPLRQYADGVLRSDWQVLVEHLASEEHSAPRRAATFHVSMAEALLQQALKVREARPVGIVGLCGGVFQNRVLSEACVCRLEQNGFDVRLGVRVPVNDAGLSFGQAVEYAAVLS